MNQQELKIKNLLECFMRAETSEEEEEMLARYFRSTQNVPEEREAYREMFDAFDDDTLAFSDDELNEVIAEAEEQTERGLLMKKIWMYSSIAGIVAAVVLVFLLMRPTVTEEDNPILAEMPQQSMRETDNSHIAKRDATTPVTAQTEVKEDKAPLHKQVAEEKPSPSTEKKTLPTTDEEGETVEVIAITDASQLASNIDMPACDAECLLEELKMASMQMMGDTYYERKL